MQITQLACLDPYSLEQDTLSQIAHTLQGWFQQLKLPGGLQQEAPAPGYAALAALCAYLKRMHANQELATGAQLVMPYELYAAALCLDGPTLANLELLEGSGGEAEGSLLAALDSCASPGT